MAITGGLYLGFVQKLIQGQHIFSDGDSTTYKVSLHTVGYVPNQDTHSTTADLSNEASNGNGYTTGGAQITLGSTTFDTTNELVAILAVDTTWATITKTFRIAVIYDTTNNYLVAWLNFGSDQSPSAENYTIFWNTTGIFDILTPVA